MVGTEKLDLGKLAERFEVHNRSDGKSSRTVEWYNQTLDIFAGWLAEEGMSNCLDDIGEDEVRLFVLHLQGRKGLWGDASSRTVNNRATRDTGNWGRPTIRTGITARSDLVRFLRQDDIPGISRRKR